MKRLSTVAIAILFMLLAVACRRGGEPPQITAGATTCASCQRVIDDMSLAAVARSSDSTVKAFDSAACLLKAIPKGDDGWQVWFHDHEGPGWIEASKAVFVIQRQGPGTPARHTPAFVDREHAKAFYQRTPGRNEIAPDYSTFRAVMSHE